MTLDYFLVEHLDEQAYEQQNFLFWTQVVCSALSFIGPEMDADLERMIQKLLEYHSKTGSEALSIDDVRHEIVRLKGTSFWTETTPLGLKYRCLNAIASSRESVASMVYNWQYGVATAFQIINIHRDKDQILIQFIRDKAREQKVELYEKGVKGEDASLH